MCLREPLLTLSVSDCSRCGAVFIVRSLAQSGTSGVADQSRCGAVLSADSQRPWQRDLGSLEGPSMTALREFHNALSEALVERSWPRSCRGPFEKDLVKILAKSSTRSLHEDLGDDLSVIEVLK